MPRQYGYPRGTFIEADEDTMGDEGQVDSPFRFTQHTKRRQSPGFRQQRDPRPRSRFSGLIPEVEEVDTASSKSKITPPGAEVEITPSEAQDTAVEPESTPMSEAQQAAMKGALGQVGKGAGKQGLMGMLGTAALGGTLGVSLATGLAAAIGGPLGLSLAVYMLNKTYSKSLASIEATEAMMGTPEAQAAMGQSMSQGDPTSEAAAIAAAMGQSEAQAAENEAQAAQLGITTQSALDLGLSGQGPTSSTGPVGPSSGGGRGEANVMGAGDADTGIGLGPTPGTGMGGR